MGAQGQVHMVPSPGELVEMFSDIKKIQFVKVPMRNLGFFYTFKIRQRKNFIGVFDLKVTPFALHQPVRAVKCDGSMRGNRVLRIYNMESFPAPSV